MCSKNNTNLADCQAFERLEDSYISAKSGKRKERPWREKKVMNMQLSEVYKYIDLNKSERLEKCASFLQFRKYSDGSLKLNSMNSCRVRLCPVCQWRRSLKNYYNNKRIADYLMSRDNHGEWLALTLTVKSVTADDLCTALDELVYAFKKLVLNVDFKRISRGYYRGIEVTHDSNEKITQADYNRRKKWLDSLCLKVGDDNPTYDLYHPHMHVLVYVNKSYFTSRDYLNHDKWVEIWRQALAVDYLPQVDIKKVKNLSQDLCGDGISGAIAEVSKYATKSTDYLTGNLEKDVPTVACLDKSLNNRRLIGYGGELLQAKKALKLEDADSGDLVNVDGEAATAEDFELVSYFWNTGVRDYGRE